MTAAACTAVRSGRRTFYLVRTRVPFVRHYFVLHAAGAGDADEGDGLDAMWRAAHEVARRLARRYQGDPGCFTVLFNGGRTRRRRQPHFHIVIAGDLSEKRRAMMCVACKRLLRWWRWPLLRRLVGPPASCAALGPELEVEPEPDETRTPSP